MLNSSSKHHTANMKLFLLTVVCVAAALAVPVEKQKREILPGDPRYGTDYHQHHHHHAQHENEVPQNNYGLPNHKAGPPLNNGYLTPVIDAKQSIPVPSYGIPEATPQIPHKVSNSYLEPAVQEAKKTPLPVTSYGVPLHNVKTTVRTHTIESEYKAPSVDATVTSYGVPSVSDLKTFDTAHTDTKIEPTHIATEVTKTVVPNVEVHEHKHVEQTNAVAKPELKVPEQVSAGQGLFQQSLSEVKSVPSTGSVDFTQTGFGGSVGTGSFGSLGSTGGFSSDISGFDTSSFSKYSSVPDFSSQVKYDTISSIPTTVYASQPSFDTGYNTGYTGFESVYPFGSFHSGIPQTLDHQVHVQPLSLQHVYPVPAPYVFRVPQHIHVPQPISVEAPQVLNYQVPHVVETKAPVAHEHVEIQKPVTSFVQNTVPAQSTLESFQVPHVDIPSVPFIKPTTQAPIADVPAPVESIDVSSTTDNESVSVENPLFKTGSQIASTSYVEPAPVKITKEYVQPTDVNGGYVY